MLLLCQVMGLFRIHERYGWRGRRHQISATNAFLRSDRIHNRLLYTGINKTFITKSGNNVHNDFRKEERGRGVGPFCSAYSGQNVVTLKMEKRPQSSNGKD